MRNDPKTKRSGLFHRPGRPRPVLFREAAEAWLDSLRPGAKESTVNKYVNLLELYVYPAIGGLETDRVDSAAVAGLCARLLSCGGTKGTGLSPKTVSCVLSVIRSVLRRAGSDAIRELSGLKLPTVRSVPKERRVLSLSEQRRLCGYLSSDPRGANLGILLSLFTGLRLGEVCALRWEDVSLADGTLRVRHTIQRVQDKSTAGRRTKVILTAPKSPSSLRTVPLTPPLAALLTARAGEGYVLTGSGQYMEPRTLQNRFKQALRSCGVADANYHALRHTFATRCVELGCDIKCLSEILGHASVGITMDRYVHPSLDTKRRNLSLLDAFFDGE